VVSHPFPYNIGILSLACFGFMMMSYIFLMLTKEPRIPPQPKQPIWAVLRNMPHLLRQDRIFTIYLLARTGMSLGILGHSFVTAAALAKFQSDGSTVGTFTVVLLAAQALGNFGLGALADRWGHKQVLVFSGLVAALSLLIAWMAPTEWWFYPVFVCGGIAMGGYQLAGFTMVMNFAGTDTRPTYIATANTFNVPVSAISPLLAGWIAGVYGYSALFIALACFGVIGSIVMIMKVALPNAQRKADTVI
jgi:MFS family permease